MRHSLCTFFLDGHWGLYPVSPGLSPVGMDDVIAAHSVWPCQPALAGVHLLTKGGVLSRGRSGETLLQGPLLASVGCRQSPASFDS